MKPVFKVMSLATHPVDAMDGGRGEKLKLINTTLGTHNVDVHLNRLITAHDLDMIYIIGPGHGGPGLVAIVCAAGCPVNCGGVVVERTVSVAALLLTEPAVLVAMAR